MKIYTKKGDTGETSLFGGQRVLKSNERVLAYGDVDEANSFIGVAASSNSLPKDLKEPFDQSIKPGKYSLAQKSMHASVTVLTLVIIVTGIIMFALIDTPWWERTNALPENLLGWVFLLHGLAALALVAITSLHIYFGLRPEKLFYTRSMIKGWISEYEKDENHDQEKWVTKN